MTILGLTLSKVTAPHGPAPTPVSDATTEAFQQVLGRLSYAQSGDEAVKADPDSAAQDEPDPTWSDPANLSDMTDDANGDSANSHPDPQFGSPAVSTDEQVPEPPMPSAETALKLASAQPPAVLVSTHAAQPPTPDLSAFSNAPKTGANASVPPETVLLPSVKEGRVIHPGPFAPIGARPSAGEMVAAPSSHADASVPDTSATLSPAEKRSLAIQAAVSAFVPERPATSVPDAAVEETIGKNPAYAAEKASQPSALGTPNIRSSGNAAWTLNSRISHRADISAPLAHMVTPNPTDLRSPEIEPSVAQAPKTTTPAQAMSPLSGLMQPRDLTQKADGLRLDHASGPDLMRPEGPRSVTTSSRAETALIGPRYPVNSASITLAGGNANRPPLEILPEAGSRADGLQKLETGQVLTQSAAPILSSATSAVVSMVPMPASDPKPAVRFDRKGDSAASARVGPGTRLDIPQRTAVEHANHVPPNLNAHSVIGLTHVRQAEIAPSTADPLARADPQEPSFAPSPSAQAPGASVVSGQLAVQVTRPLMQAVSDAAVQLKTGQTEIALSPEELGRVAIRMTQTDTGLVVLLTVERDDTQALMRKHISDLADSLRAAGFGEAQIDFSDRHDHPGGGAMPWKRGMQPKEAQAAEGPVPPQSSAAPDISDRIDIRM